MRAALTARPAIPLSSLRWALLLAGLLTAVLIFAGRGYSTALLGLSVIALGGLAAVVDRRLVVPLIIALIPLEILRDISATLPLSGIADRVTNSTLVSVRLAVVAAGAYWTLTARPGWERLLPRSRLILPAFMLLAVYIFGTIYTMDLGAEHLPQNEGSLVALGSSTTEAALTTAALTLHLALLFLVPMFVRDWPTFRLCVWTFIVIAVVLAFAGVFQQISGTYFWNPELGLADVPRINTTFRDPNIYARLLIMGLVVGIAMAFSVSRNWRLPTLMGVIVPCALALVFTNSRSGFLIAAGILPLTFALMPLSMRARIYTVAGAFAGTLTLLLVAVLVFEAAFLERIATFEQGSAVLGARQVLIEGGWEMFRDHPIFGVGLAGFQDAFQGPYSRYYAELDYRVSLSHTDVITVLAELGIIGGLVVGFLFFRFASTIIDLVRHTEGGRRALTMGVGLAVLAIVLSAQSEGRLLSEPYLWLMFGLTLALEGIIRRERGLDPPDSAE